MAALGALSMYQVEALLPVVAGGLSCTAGAETRDIPLGTVMARVGRARKRLRQWLDTPAPLTKDGT